VSLEPIEEIACDMTSVLNREFPAYHPKACLAAARLGRLLGEEALSCGAKEILEEVLQSKMANH